MDEHNKRSGDRRDAMITLHVPRSVLTALWALGSLIALALVAVAFVAGLALRPVMPTAAPVVVTTIILEATATSAPIVAAINVSTSPTVVASPTALPTDIPTTQPTIDLIRPTAAFPTAMLPTAASTATPDTVDFRIDSPPGAEGQPPAANAPVQAAIAQPQPQAAPPGGAPAARPADAGGSGGSARPVATARPAQHALRGSVRWSAASSPILIQNDLLVSSGASLIIEPGVEVQIGRGVSLVIDGSMVALATPDQPVRFTQIGGGDDPRLRWESIIGRAGSVIDLRNVTITGGGAGGSVLTVQAGRLSLQSARIINNGGHLRIDDSFVIIRDSEISGNRMPYGSAIDITLSRGGGDSPGSDIVIVNNRILNNALVAGTAPLRITNLSFERPARIEIEQNLLVGAAGPNLALFTNAQLMGNVRCNTLIGGANGLSLRSDAPPNLSPMLNIRDNAIEAHEPPNNPFYRQFNIGKGATSDLPLTMTNNWWELPSGPYEPAANPEGRGEAVGPNITFLPWLPERPACAPRF
ncbi:hypothetical protein [Roseiflexus sp.]|uniref:hypothetical protein n=1 Tax=Roseiflexus sp. TaxID=2562120 RepID=UPI0021DD562D|nr:hypothetical protein [Roseiflexus sp.]GIW01891.1 MAG: hypothetical protein KatS3mg058_3294 [Roseiflexus sp.]